MMKHKLIVIGYLGLKRCYLDVPREAAIERWKRATGYQYILESSNIVEIDFNDEFGTYDVWAVQ